MTVDYLGQAVNAVNSVNFETEATLDPAIQFPHPRSNRLGGSDTTHQASDIFLTGATGFLGAFLLAELLRRTTANIHCLIRTPDPASGQQRLGQHLDRFGLWQDAFRTRIIPIPGDLSQPLFGLSVQQFNALAAQVEMIYHNGGLLNAARPYLALKPTNVLGTQEVLRLAGLTRTKPVHFTSTLSLFFTPTYATSGRISETDVPILDAHLKGGYKRSKWCAEQLVIAAQDRGLPACIYRPIRIAGHSTTGITSSQDDLLNSLLKSCILMAQWPELDIDIPLVPVDYVSHALIHLSLQEASFGKSFHFVNPHPMAWSAVGDFLRSCGYPLVDIGYEQWRGELKRRSAEATGAKKELYTRLRLLLNAPNNLFIPKPAYALPHTQAGLAGTSLVCPPVDASLMATYVSYFQKNGYFPLPHESGLSD